MGSLSNLYISQSYQSLIHLGTNNTASAALIGLEDGLGNSIGVSVNTAGNLYLSGTFSASLQDGYLYVGNASGRTIAVPSSSIKIDTGSLLTTASFNQYTASTNIRLNNLESTSASVNIAISNINAYTQSNDIKWQDLGNKSGSWITESETGSFARTNVDNNFTANQTFTNISAVSASFRYVQTLYETSSVIYSSGSNQFGDELTDIQTLSGSVKVQGSLTLNGVAVLTSSTDITSLNAFTSSQNEKNATLEGVTSSLQAYTQSNNQKWSNLASQSGSWVTAAITGSSLVTASVNLNTITFTKGDNSTFAIVVNTGSAATPLTSLNQFTQSQYVSNSFFATTGSNTFYGDQIINGTLNINSAFANSVFDVGELQILGIDGRIKLNGSNGSTLRLNGVSTSGMNDFDIRTIDNSGTGIIVLQNANNNFIFAKFDGNDTTTIYNKLNVEGSVNITGSLTASLQQGYVWVGDANGTSSIVATSSFAENTDLTSLNAFTSSANSRLNSLESKTGSYATTGSNLFVGDETITGYVSASIFQGPAANISTVDTNLLEVNNFNNSTFGLYNASGSAVLVARTFTTASAHLSASANTLTNLIFKSNNNTADTVISGSDNIISNPAAPTAGFKRYVGGTSNIFLNTSSTPQISASMAWSPSFNSNLAINGTAQNSVTWRGPVSSSTSNINSNIFAGGNMSFGTSATLNAERATAGINASANLLLNGAFAVVANTTTLPAAPALNANILFGAQTTLLLYSSSMQYNSNIQNGGITVNNRYSPSAGSVVGALSARANINTIYGIGHDIQIDGTNTSTSQTKQFIANIIAGYYISSSMGTGDSCNILATGMIGNGLTVTGSSTVANANAGYSPNSTQGSMFVGRFNATDGNKAKTAETVLAVGTGTTTTRKTAFLIDSGSNSYFEGTLTVSGSTTLSGSAFINNLGNGITANVVTYNSSTGELRKATLADILSASFDAAEFWSTTTQSGSAGVSGSITFNNSGSVAGVSVVNNRQVTLSQAGTYNIQFSAQIETSAGADTVYMWFKKNGTNINDSASKVVLPNNTAQIMTVNIFDEGVANDYYELAYQTTNGNATVLYEPASGNIPAIPSVILTIQQLR